MTTLQLTPPADDSPRIRVGDIYPILFGNRPYNATVTRIYPEPSGMMRIELRIEGVQYQHSETVADFVYRVKQRMLYDNRSVDSIAVDLGWLR